MTFRSLVPARSRSVSPVWGLRSGFGDLFDEFFADAGGLSRVARADFVPSVDIEEDEHEIRLIADLPGVEEKDFEVLLEEDVLTLKGEKRSQREEKREGYAHVERTSGSFERRFRIPWEVDPEALKASFKNGVLTVSIPKPVQNRPEPRTIPVQSA